MLLTAGYHISHTVETFTIIDSVFWFLYETSNTSHYHPDKLQYYRCFWSHSGSVMHTSHTFVYTLAYTHTYCRVSYSEFLITRLRRLLIQQSHIWIRNQCGCVHETCNCIGNPFFVLFYMKNYKRKITKVVCVKGSNVNTHRYTPLWDVQLKMEDQVL